MSQKISSTNGKGLIFDVTGMTKEEMRLYFPERDKDITNYVLVGYAWHLEEIVHNYCFYEPTFEEPERMIKLDHTDYPQLLMLKHLAWADIINYFQNI